MKQIVILSMFFLLLLSLGYAQEVNEIGILTVTELDNGSYEGGVASLELEVREGSGSIFIESFPLSNVDTQAVTRIATDIACSYVNEVNCDDLDFFYTIRTTSGYVRGPSAGGATALLALATLQGESVRHVAMTGGISSAGLITPVGGVKEKTRAAVEEGYELIIIPQLSLNVSYNESNISALYLDDLQTPQGYVHPVYSLSEAYYLATGTPLPVTSLIEPPTYYTQRMKETSGQLCQRTLDLFEAIEEKNLTFTNSSQDYYNRSLEASAQGDYYSAASFCYSANLRLREQLVQEQNQDVKHENFIRLTQSIDDFEEQIDEYKLKTFSDLEAYIIVKERLYEAREYIDAINNTNISSNVLSLAIERYYSAVAWSGFFGIEGEPLDIDETSLEFACIKEIKEVEARTNYLKTALPIILLEDILLQLDSAYEQYNQENYPLCIFRASKAKASAHMFMNEVQEESQLQPIFDVKLQRAQELIAQQQTQGVFPIIGYSYFEYSQQLKDDQPYLSLLFMEYTLSMADVSKYFPKKMTYLSTPQEFSKLFYLLLGILIGVVLTTLLSKRKEQGQMRMVKQSPKKKVARKKASVKKPSK